MPAHPKYNKEMCDQIIEWFEIGMTIVEVCQKLKVTRQSYYDWKKKHPAFRKAAEYGEEAAEAYYCKLGRQAMIGKRAIDNTIYCFTMKTRFKHRETEDPKNTNMEGSVPLQINFQVSPAVDEIEITNSLQQQAEEKEKIEQGI